MSTSGKFKCGKEMYPILITIHTKTTFRKASVFCSDGLGNINPLLSRQLPFWCVKYLHQQAISRVLFKNTSAVWVKIPIQERPGYKKFCKQKHKDSQGAVQKYERRKKNVCNHHMKEYFN